MPYGIGNPTIGGSPDVWGQILNDINDKSEQYAVRGQATFDIRSPASGTYTLILNNRIPFDVTQATYVVDEGSCDFTLSIDGVNIAGIAGIAASTSQATSAATGSNAVGNGADLKITFSNVSNVGAFQINIWGNQTAVGQV